MKFESEIKDGAIVIRFLAGQAGEEYRSGLIQTADDAIEKGIHYCLAELSDLKYINSTDIGVLVTLLTKFRNAGGEMAVSGISDHIRKLLIVTKLNAIFPIYESEKEALKNLKNKK